MSLAQHQPQFVSVAFHLVTTLFVLSPNNCCLCKHVIVSNLYLLKGKWLKILIFTVQNVHLFDTYRWPKFMQHLMSLGDIRHSRLLKLPRNSLKVLTLYRKSWKLREYFDFWNASQEKVQILKISNLKILLSFWALAVIFAFYNNFYRFQNNI